jgi:hypothetical protein
VIRRAQADRLQYTDWHATLVRALDREESRYSTLSASIRGMVGDELQLGYKVET